MSLIEPLPTEKLYYHCDPGQFTFTDTRELPDGEVMLGQERALEAFNFALQRDGVVVQSRSIKFCQRRCSGGLAPVK